MDIEKYTREFQDKAPTYAHLEGEALYSIKRALGHADVKLHSITSRVKNLESFLDKIRRKQSSDPFEDIQDIVGLRVICLFLSDINRIRDAIRSSFLVITEDNKIEEADVSSFGYMSVHFVVTMKPEYVGPRYDHIANMRFEIQVRTIAMDAWANVSHHLEYKSEMDVPSDLRRDFYALSGLFYVADKHFEMFYGASRRSQQRMAELFETATPKARAEELNLDSLTAYLRNKFPERVNDTKTASELVNELLKAGYTTIGDIDRVVDRAEAAVRLYEQRYRAKGVRPIALSDVGVVRVSARLVDEDYFHKIYRPGDNPLNWDESAIEDQVNKEKQTLGQFRALLKK